VSSQRFGGKQTCISTRARDRTNNSNRKTRGACHQWAQQQTGVNPQQIAEQSLSLQSYQQQPQGVAGRAVLGTSAKGTALGAVGGAIGGDARKGAAIGAAVGALGGFFRQRHAVAEQHQYNQAVGMKEKAALDQFQQAYQTCLRGRGYTVN